jgi:UDP-N-acetylglucosamine transferase subunit ALG13
MRELVDDHQVLTARKFAALGHVLEFSDRSELMRGIANLGHFSPVERKPNVEGIASAIGDYMTGLVGSAPDRT